MSSATAQHRCIGALPTDDYQVIIDGWQVDGVAPTPVQRTNAGLFGTAARIASNAQDLYNFLDEATQRRKVSSTKMNAESSRSHLIVSIVLKLKDKQSGDENEGKITFVSNDCVLDPPPLVGGECSRLSFSEEKKRDP